MTGHSAIAGLEHDAALAACLLAVDPCGLGGASVRSAYGPAVTAFLKTLQSLLPAGAPFRRVPLHIADGRLLGGLDLAATLQAGRPVLERGLLADADGGCAVLPMAERLPLAMVARLCSVLDSKEVVVERDGFACRNTSRIAVIALDEGASDDERPPAALLDRLALHLDLQAAQCDDDRDAPFDAGQIASARAMLPAVTADAEMVKAICSAAAAIGIASARAPMFAMKVACIHAALSGRRRVEDEDAIVATRLVLAPRATILPLADASPEQSFDRDQKPNSSAPDSSAPQSADNQSTAASGGELEDVVLQATRAAIPARVLAQLQSRGASRTTSIETGRAGARSQSARRGRPVGTRRGELKAGARLNIVETLRSAAPWQRLRREQSGSGQVHVRRDDFRLTRLKHRSVSATIFVVDASGSAALHRLAEAKGAVELLLADCYVRRDQVALIAFRGKSADLILPPTRSLARAKRSLSALPAGGGTPVAAALEAAGILAVGLRRKGLSPTIVLLTDGRANVARDGNVGREQAEMEAITSARRLRAAGVAALVVDISPRPRGAAGKLADNMGARYLALPNADARILSRAVRTITPRTTMPHFDRGTAD
jgi:magnesium chelatase subunit D